MKAGGCYSRPIYQVDKSGLAPIKANFPNGITQYWNLKIRFSLPERCTNNWPVEVDCNRGMTETILRLTFTQHTTDSY